MAREAFLNWTDEEICGQLLCCDISGCDDFESTVKKLRRIRPGGIYVANMPKEKIAAYAAVVNGISKVPVIVAADMENGPGGDFSGYEMLPHAMAWGACRDESLIERAGRAVAHECRRMGIHWTFSPVCDLSLNPDSPVANVRCISDDAALTAKLAAAYIRGLQTGGMVACCKHFPGDGADSRNQHFVTSVNSLSAETWMASYGKIYRAAMDADVASVMAGHIALPAYQKNIDEFYGPLPAVLSEELKIGLLKKKFGFKGCVISDAMSMIGSCSRCRPEKLAAEFIRTGGDMVLFPDDEDFERLLNALQSGVLPRERAEDALLRVLRLKERAGLFSRICREPCGKEQESVAEVSREIAEKSVYVVRNMAGVLPLRVPKGEKILLVNLFYENSHRRDDDRMATLQSELTARGYRVQVLENPKHYAVKESMQNAFAVFLNIDYTPMNCGGGSLRMGWEQMMALWRGYILEHPRLVAVSFGDPYKLFELPYLKTYINAFSYAPSSQRAAVRVIFGEIEGAETSPVSMDTILRGELRSK